MRQLCFASFGKLPWGKKACALFLLLATSAIASSAQSLKTIHNFNNADGWEPVDLVQATNGSLYGTASVGGAAGYGTVFKITTTGALTTLLSLNGNDGSLPGQPLLQATDGSLYGTFEAGGANLTLCGGTGCGTVFKITLSGKLTTLYNFCSQSNCTDGSGPFGALVQAANGNFYGTTEYDGAYSLGTVFRMTPGGTLTTLHSFCAQQGPCPDGAYPAAGLVQAIDGNFYGTTASSTVFKITPSGTLTTLHTFCGGGFSSCTDGFFPGPLIQAADGNLYGRTLFGGVYTSCTYITGQTGCGTVFRITPSGTLTTLHSFNKTDGAGPFELTQATDGNFYGTTTHGGVNGAGTIFKITPSGTLTTIHNFCAQSGCPDGSWPTGLIQDTDGKFYGSTVKGGTSTACTDGCGTIYSLAAGLGPFLETQRMSGVEGAKIVVLGQGFSSASIVKFGGTKATAVTLGGPTYLTASVPAKALTGSVTVTTGTTTLSSTKMFRVLPTITSIPSSGTIGAPVVIDGTELTQTTKVTFGGVAATSVTVNSDTQVTADVPTDAKTGKIVVTTKGGSATSNSTFTVN